MQSQEIYDQAQEIQAWIVGLRRQLHRFPELMYEEVKTSQLVRVMTDRAGLVTVYARGAKREYRRGGAAMDTLARSEWILRSRRGADFGARFLLEQVEDERSSHNTMGTAP